MSSSEDTTPAAGHMTEITVVTGVRYRVEGAAKDIERTILNAARGSIMELAWFVEAETRIALAVNPQYVVALRAAGAAAAAPAARSSAGS